MTNESEPNATEWTDDRARQDTLPNEQPRSERESRIDSGASESFADDRNADETADAGEQAALGAEHVDDGNQRDLTGDRASEEAPEWADDEPQRNDGMPGFRPSAVVGSRSAAENAEADR